MCNTCKEGDHHAKRHTADEEARSNDISLARRLETETCRDCRDCCGGAEFCLTNSAFRRASEKIPGGRSGSSLRPAPRRTGTRGQAAAPLLIGVTKVSLPPTKSGVQRDLGQRGFSRESGRVGGHCLPFGVVQHQDRDQRADARLYAVCAHKKLHAGCTPGDRSVAARQRGGCSASVEGRRWRPRGVAPAGRRWRQLPWEEAAPAWRVKLTQVYLLTCAAHVGSHLTGYR